MNISSIIQSQREEDSDLGLDFASFLLRYHRELDYADFTDDAPVVQKIKRAETYRSWADIEDLANGFESLQSNVEQHQSTAANAFQELYNYIEKTKKELAAKDDEQKAEIMFLRDDIRRLVGIYNPEKDDVIKEFGKARLQVNDFLSDKIKSLENQIEEKLLKRLDALERGIISGATSGGIAPKINIITGGSGPGQDQVAQQLAMIQSQQQISGSQAKQLSEMNQLKLEESLRDHVEILQTLNAKLNNHISQSNEQRTFTNERFDKLEKNTLNKDIENIPSRYDLIQHEQTLKKIVSDIDSIRNDHKHKASNELEIIRQQEVDAFFKKTANDYFAKLRVVEDEMRQLKDERSIFRFENKVSILEQEVVDLKNVRKNAARSHQLINITPDYTEKFDILVDEVNQLWSFLQRFIDEQVIDAITRIRSPDHSYKEKMNEMDWLARNAEFLSPDSITKCLMSFKELYNSDSIPNKNAYINAKHTSQSIVTVIHLIEHTKLLNRDDETLSRLAILISILEPLLINDMNLEKALNCNAVEVLLSLLYIPQELQDADFQSQDVKKRLPLYLKYTLRCITSSIRSPVGVSQFMKVPTSIPQVLEFLEKMHQEEEILANSAKVIRIVLRDDKWYDQISAQHSDLGNTLLRSLDNYQFSEIVLIELLAAVRNFTRVSSKVVFIAKQNINPIITELE